MTNKECIDRWAEVIIPTVLRAEDELRKSKPEWTERLRKLAQPGGEDPHKVAEEYCHDIARIIVTKAADYDKNEHE